MGWDQVTFVLGGARSGKSAYAEGLVMREPAPWTYLATGQIYDEEMAERVALHQSRRGLGWQTVDAPLDLAASIYAAQGQPILVDCLTFWLTNLMLGAHDVEAAKDSFCSALAQASVPVVIVSNEVGLGIVPDNALARRFRDEAGRLHQRIAAHAARVVLCVAGIPMAVKGDLR